MLTLNLTNTSGVAIAAGDGVLPKMFSWMSIGVGANVNCVIQVGDLTKEDQPNAGFTVGEMLQSLKQRGKITYNVTDVGDSEDTGSVADHCVATAA
jgi:hypothetical protein